MSKNEIENLIKEHIKDKALRIYELDNEDRKSLLAEYKEWIINDLNFEEVMMLPYEAYTDKLNSDYLEDLL
jgi:predicted nucleic acid-binding protein